MKESRDLVMAGEKLGTVTFWQEGLYMHFSCRCRLSGEVMFHLMAQCADGVCCLGLLCPMDGVYGLEKRIPMKQLGQGRLEFSLRPRHAPVGGRFVPMRCDEPFAFLDQIAQARYAVRDGQRGLVLPEEKN